MDAQNLIEALDAGASYGSNSFLPAKRERAMRNVFAERVRSFLTEIPEDASIREVLEALEDYADPKNGRVGR